MNVTDQYPNVPGVEFKAIPGHLGYCAGNDGSIWSCLKTRGKGLGRPCQRVFSNTWKQMKGSPFRKEGRLRFMLRRDDGSTRVAQCAVFVAEAFLGPRPSGMECCHNDGNCLNNSIENLRWDTRAGNNADKLKHGTQPRGMEVLNSKLSENDVREIRRGSETQANLARRYGVSQPLICMIRNNKTWTHVQ